MDMGSGSTEPYSLRRISKDRKETNGVEEPTTSKWTRKQHTRGIQWSP